MRTFPFPLKQSRIYDLCEHEGLVVKLRYNERDHLLLTENEKDWEKPTTRILLRAPNRELVTALEDDGIVIDVNDLMPSNTRKRNTHRLKYATVDYGGILVRTIHLHTFRRKGDRLYQGDPIGSLATVNTKYLPHLHIDISQKVLFEKPEGFFYKKS